MPEKRIIARATAAGTRRLVAVPLDDPLEQRVAPEDARRTAVTSPPATGLNAFLASAQRQGAALVDAARDQAERIAREAREEGYAAGYEDGKATAEREVGDLISFAENAVREVAEVRARTLDESEEALVRLSVQIAEKILQVKLDLQPELVADVLRGALRKAYVRDQLQVVCNPDDLARIESASDDLRAHLGTLKNLELVGDRRIGRGGVIVRTPAGDVDATIDSQLERLRDAMLRTDEG